MSTTTTSVAAFMVVDTAFTAQGKERRCEVIEAGSDRVTTRWYGEADYGRLARSHKEYKRRYVTDRLIDMVEKERASAPDPSLRLLNILEANHMTAVVTTESGSRYTAIARPAAGVALIHDVKGWVCQGQSLKVVDGHLELHSRRHGRLARTTKVVHVNILSN